MLSPENVLKRGYTITSLNGRIVKRRDQLETDDIIDTKFSDGSVSSKIVEKKC
jgi:exodeoxyribonuclease VII large subunit